MDIYLIRGSKSSLNPDEGLHSLMSSNTTSRMTSEDQMWLWSKPEPQNPYLGEDVLQAKVQDQNLKNKRRVENKLRYYL